MYKQNEVKISDSEWLILQVIWSKNVPMRMGEIASALSYTPWKRTTIQTMVARLVTKDILGTNQSDYAFLYYPIVAKEAALEMYTKSFIERVYEGNTAELVAAIATGDYLSAEEKKALKKSL